MGNITFLDMKGVDKCQILFFLSKCFLSLMELTHSNDGHIKYDAFCIFLVEVSITPREICNWEYRHFPGTSNMSNGVLHFIMLRRIPFLKLAMEPTRLCTFSRKSWV